MFLVLFIRSLLQAFFINHLQDWPNALLLHVRSRSGGEGAVAEEQWPVISPRQLRRFTNGERAHTDGDLDAGRAICAGGHVCWWK